MRTEKERRPRLGSPFLLVYNFSGVRADVGDTAHLAAEDALPGGKHIGKVSFGADKLYENYSALIGAIIKAKPAAAKGQYIKSCVAAATMGPGVKMNANKQI